MTLLTICQNAADEIGLTPPASVIGNSEGEVMKLRRYANKVGTKIMKAYAWQALRKERVFTAIAGEEQTGILPADWDRIIPDTFWDRNLSYLVTGPVSPVEWQGLKALNSEISERKFALRGGSVLVYPPPAGGETFAFEYVSKYWAANNGAPQAALTQDSNTAIVDEELITRGVIYEYLMNDGQPAGAALVEYQRYFDTLVENDRQSSGVLRAGDMFRSTRRFGGTPPVRALNSL